MKIRALLSALLLAAGLAFVAEAKESKQIDSPTEVFKKHLAAFQDLDLATVADLSSGEARASVLQVIEEQKKLKQAAESGDEKAKAKLAMLQQLLEDTKTGMKQMKIKVKGELIEGDLAVVVVAMSGVTDGSSKQDQAYFKKVGGEWKFISRKEYKAEKEKALKK